MSRPLEEWSRQELIDALRALERGAADGGNAISLVRAVHELRVHQIELEMQNRDLREAHNRLEDARSRYADLYDLAPIGYCTLDRRGLIVDANLAAARLFGTTRTMLAGRPLASMVSIDFAQLHAHLAACFASRMPVTSEVAIRRDGGEPTVVQMVSTPQQPAGGGPATTCMTTLTDISMLKHSERRLGMLSSVSELLATSLDYRAALPAVVALTVPALADLAFVDVCEVDGRIDRFRSDGVRSAPDYAQALQGEILRTGKPLLVADARVGALVSALGELTGAELALGGATSGAILLVPLLSRGRTLGVFTFMMSRSARTYSSVELTTAQDVAARAAMAVESARLYEREQRAVRAREDVLAVVSHDLKNPLHGIRLNCDHLIETAPPVERRSGRKQVEAIRRGVDRMVHMIRDLSEEARIEAGHLVLERADHVAGALIGDAIDLLRPIAEQKRVALVLSPRLPTATVSCDRSRVLQVLSNLVGNAIKFTPAGGEIGLDASEGDGRIRFAVRDSGSGIDSEQLPHVFDRYWKADERARSGGSGLGLFIAKSIVEAHGGEIGVTSRFGHGTTVWFTLPLGHRGTAERTKETPAPMPERPAAAVLVVDDDEATREALCDVLSSRGYRAQAAANGDEALRRLRSGESRPCLILLDLKMPVMDGWTMKSALRGDPSLTELPVVLVSDAPELEREALSMGAVGYVRKPIDVDKLFAAVDALCCAK